MSSVKDFEFAGSVSWGTMRPQDLIPLFMGVLEALNPMEAKGLRRDYKAVFAVLDEGKWDDVEEALWARAGNHESRMTVEHQRWQDKVSYCLDALFEALNAAAPEGYEFGSSEGDGADYGFWACEEDGDDLDD